jgi:spore coat polysaccharide biosynthesis predicted glycosyltransferase SpsG
VIEGLGGDSLAEECDGVADLLVTPYAVDPARHARTKRTRQLIGAQYAVLDTAYRDRRRPARAMTAHGRRILVTTGGADPTEAVRLVLEACEEIRPAPLEVHVVVGPFFSASLRRWLTEAAARSVHRISLIEAPDDLLAEMLWCDLAVATSGLTKYELAATGTPAVLLSHDAAHARNNQAFSALGTALDLGEADKLGAPAIASAVEDLLQHPCRRAAMSESGRAAVDGAGAERIIDAIEELTQ